LAKTASIHKLAQQLIARRKEFLIPGLEGIARGKDPWGNALVEREPVFSGETVAFQSCALGKAIGDVTPDVVCSANGREVLVEIVVFHRLMPDKQERLMATGRPCFVIDLSEFKQTQVRLELLERAIFHNRENRYWLFHPDEVAARDRAAIRLGKKLGALRMQFEAKMPGHANFSPRYGVRPQSSGASAYCETPAPKFAGRNAEQIPTLSGSEPTWRASLPDLEQVELARGAFTARLGLDRRLVDGVTGVIVRRGQLAGVFPIELAQEWAAALNLSEVEAMRYLYEAGYLL
jgi:hypothetical protein